SPRATASCGRRAGRAAVPGEEDYLDCAAGSRQFPVRFARFRTRRICYMLTAEPHDVARKNSDTAQRHLLMVLWPELAWRHAAVCASAAAARPSPVLPPQSARAAVPAPADCGRTVRGTAVVPANPEQD